MRITCAEDAKYVQNVLDLYLNAFTYIIPSKRTTFKLSPINFK